MPVIYLDYLNDQSYMVKYGIVLFVFFLVTPVARFFLR